MKPYQDKMDVSFIKKKLLRKETIANREKLNISPEDTFGEFVPNFEKIQKFDLENISSIKWFQISLFGYIFTDFAYTQETVLKLWQ